MFKRMLSSVIKSIDLIQNQVDDLIELMRGHPHQEEDEFVRQTYNLSPRQSQLLAVMILKLQDDQLKSRAVVRLQKWIADDAGALKYFLDIQQLSAMLKMIYNPCCATEDLV